MGHEGIGVIVQTGSGVKTLKVGDRVTAGVVGCGYCDHCLRGRFTCCLTYDPSTLVDLPGLGDDSGVGLGGAQGMYACMSETLARQYLTSDALAGVIISSAIHPCPLRGFDMLQAPARH